MSRRNRRYGQRNQTTKANAPSDINAKLAQSPTIINDILEMKVRIQSLEHLQDVLIAINFMLMLVARDRLGPEFYRLAEGHWTTLQADATLQGVDLRAPEFLERIKAYPYFDGSCTATIPTQPGEPCPFDPTDADNIDTDPMEGAAVAQILGHFHCECGWDGQPKDFVWSDERQEWVLPQVRRLRLLLVRGGVAAMIDRCAYICTACYRPYYTYVPEDPTEDPICPACKSGATTEEVEG